MDILEFVTILFIIAVIAVLTYRMISLADARARIELQKRLQKSKERTSATQRGRIQEEEDSADLGAWVGPLLEQFGVDPDVLFEDEMPAELKTLVPLAKGFVQSGGLQKFLSAAAGQQQQSPPGRELI